LRPLSLLIAAFALLLGGFVLSAPATAQPIEIRPADRGAEGLRPVICLPPRVLRFGRCVAPERVVVCTPPKVLRNGRCVVPNLPVVCVAPRVLRNGRCVIPDTPLLCRAPKVWRNGRCVDPLRPIVCRPPQVLRGGRCVLPPRPPECRSPRVMRGGRCVLPDRPNCRLPYIYSGIERRCVLPVPVPPILPPPACDAPWRFSASAGGCICPSGNVVVNGECVRRDSQSCTFPFVYSGSKNRCVCAQGYSAYGTGCAPDKPRPTPQENITWIQTCLNAAGFDAGPEDGLVGRKTKSAWSEFRDEAGLGDADVPYTDPETLAKLFAACQADAPGGTPPATQGNDSAATADDDATAADATADSGPAGPGAVPVGGFLPAPAMCATGKLYRLLSGEKAEIAPCGKSCIPAPEGMSEEELAAQAESQGITWCSACITVGDLGMLCPSPVTTGGAKQPTDKAD
jgi:hypothetical protein